MKRTILFFLLLGAYIPLFGQQISLDNFLENLITYHPVFHKENLTWQIEQAAQKSELGLYDWQFKSDLMLSRENPDITIAEPERTDAIFVQAGIENLSKVGFLPYQHWISA